MYFSLRFPEKPKKSLKPNSDVSAHLTSQKLASRNKGTQGGIIKHWQQNQHVPDKMRKYGVSGVVQGQFFSTPQTEMSLWEKKL